MHDAAATTTRLILASMSPRRRSFLAALGLDFEALAADLDERPLPDEGPAHLASRLAEEKALAIAHLLKGRAHAEPATLVIAADTVVALDNHLLGKPLDAADARRMLVALRDRDHSVISAIYLLNLRTGERSLAVNETIVTMRAYSDDEFEAYIDTGDPIDKAGGYAIQHPLFRPVRCIQGCLSGVMGFPLRDLCALLARHGVMVTAPLPPICESHGEYACCARGQESTTDN